MTEISPAENASKLQHLHSCFHLDSVVSNYRWIFLLNSLYISLHSSSVREFTTTDCARGNLKIKLTLHGFSIFIFFIFSLGALNERIKESMTSGKLLSTKGYFTRVACSEDISPLRYHPSFHESISLCVIHPFNRNPMEKSWQKQTFNSTK